ncbi:MAG: LCP family protein [Sciscionella sp.]
MADAGRDAARDGARTRRGQRWRPWARRCGKALLVLVSVLVLGASGYAWVSYRNLQAGVVRANVLTPATTSTRPGPHGPGHLTNVLLVGVDSRSDAHGDPLPPTLLASLHAGANQGEANTDTIMVARIAADGRAAVVFSIPRDAYVAIPGQGMGKINSVAPAAAADTRAWLRAGGVSDPAEINRRARTAGSRALVAAVQRLTGLHIEHYAEVNLVGFAQIATALGGVRVCLAHPVSDPDFSGAHFPAGIQTLSGPTALAFVRQRHGLPRGDLDRERRQQAFLAAATDKLLSAGVLTNPARIQALQRAVSDNLILDPGWNVITFARQLAGLDAARVRFTTIPIINPAGHTAGGASIVVVDPAQIRQWVANLLRPEHQASTRSTTAPTSAAAPTPAAQAAPSGQPARITAAGIPCVN